MANALKKKLIVKAKKPKATKSTIDVDCLTFKQGDRDLVCFHMNGRELWKLVQINKRVDDKDEGYQRALSESRAKKVASFIKSNHQMPTSLLVAFDHAKLSADKKTLSISNRPDAGWVIDGQHRLAGIHESKIDFEIPVTAFLQLPIEQQVFQFITVNKEAKGVPTSLFYDLLKYLPPRTTVKQRAEERARDIATDLKTDETSAFAGRIVVNSSATNGQLSLSAFIRKVQRLVNMDTGVLRHISQPKQSKCIENYFSALSNVFPKEYREDLFFKTLGFGAIMGAFDAVFHYTTMKYKGFKTNNIISMLSEIHDFDFEIWRQSGTGEKAERVASEAFRDALDDVFGSDDNHELQLDV